MKRIHWRPDQETELWRFHLAGWSISELAARYAKTAYAIQRKLWKIHRCEGEVKEWERHKHITAFPIDDKCPWTDRERRILFESTDDGLPIERISELLGRSVECCQIEDRRIRHAGAKPLLPNL